MGLFENVEWANQKERWIQFCNECDPKTQDYHAKELQKDKSFWGAAQSAAKLGDLHRFLDVKTISHWNSLISKGTSVSSNIKDLDPLLNKLNEVLIQSKSDISPVKQVEMIADIFRSFIVLEPFGENTKILAKLIANYMAMWFKIPVFVFRKSEEDQLKAALKNPSTARLFIFNKRKEAIITQTGRLGLRVLEDTYRDTKGEITFHWNHFQKEVDAWV